MKMKIDDRMFQTYGFVGLWVCMSVCVCVLNYVSVWQCVAVCIHSRNKPFNVLFSTTL